MTMPDIPPVPVRVVSVAPGTIGPGAYPAKTEFCTVRTFLFSAASPSHVVLPADATRLIAYVQAGGNNVVICTDKGMEQDPANLVAGLPAPNGLVIPFGNTGPYPLRGINEFRAVAASYPAQLTVSIIHESA